MRLRIILSTIPVLVFVSLGELTWWLAGNDFSTRSHGRAVWFVFELLISGAFVPLVNLGIDAMEGK